MLLLYQVDLFISLALNIICKTINAFMRLVMCNIGIHLDAPKAARYNDAGSLCFCIFVYMYI